MTNCVKEAKLLKKKPQKNNFSPFSGPYNWGLIRFDQLIQHVITGSVESWNYKNGAKTWKHELFSTLIENRTTGWMMTIEKQPCKHWRTRCECLILTSVSCWSFRVKPSLLISVYQTFLSVFKWLIWTTNIRHLFLYQGLEVIFEVQAGCQLAVGGRKECRGSLRSTVSPPTQGDHSSNWSYWTFSLTVVHLMSEKRS